MEDNGHWITLENGVHVLIKDGQSIDEALAEQFDTDDDSSFDSDEHLPRVKEKVEIRETFMSKIKSNRTGDIEVVRRLLDKKETYHEDIDNAVLKAAEHITKIKFSESGDSGFSPMFNEITYNLSGNYGLPNAEAHDINTIAHELGHKIDHMYGRSTGYWNSWYSSKYKSKKYDKTMYEMAIEEFNQHDPNDLYLAYGKKFRKQYKKYLEEHESKGNYNGWSEEHYGLLNEYSDIMDTCRAIFLDKIRTPNHSGSHSIQYFSDYDRKESVGTEIFAEITANYFMAKKTKYIEFMEKYAPKTLEIYHEIIGEVDKL